MAGGDRQLDAIRQRLRELLSTHLDQLNPEPWAAEVGTVVLEQGARAQHVLLVQSGRLAVNVIDGAGQAQTLAVVEAGEILGEMGLFGDQRHTARVVVIEGPAQLLVVQDDALLRAVLFDSELALELLALSSRRCREGNHHLGLLLDGLQALHSGDLGALNQCCERLQQAPASLRHAGQLLNELASRIPGPTATGGPGAPSHRTAGNSSS